MVRYATGSASDDFDPFAGEAFDPTGAVMAVDDEFGGGGSNPQPGGLSSQPGGVVEAVAIASDVGVATEIKVAPPETAPARNAERGNGHGNGHAAEVSSSTVNEIPPEFADMIWEDRPLLKSNGAAAKFASFVEEPKNGKGNLAEVTDPLPQRLVITLDAVGDKLLLRRVYDALISHPGDDHFTLVVTETDGRQYELDFYNESTTRYGDELMAQLLKFVKRDAIAVRPLN
jgi:hypothetical protein